MAKKTLSCTIKVNDNFTSSLNKFTQSIQKSEQAFNRFANSLDKATNKIVTNINRINTKLTAMQQKTNSIASNISNTSIRQANTMQQNQERVIGKIEQRYQQMEQRIIRNLNNISNNTRTTLNGFNSGGNGNNGNNTRNTNSGSDGDYNILRSFLGGNFGSIIGKLGLVGAGITGVTTVVKAISATMDTGFDILNKASGNMFSYEGIEEAMKDSMNFESGRQSLDLFYGNNGEKEYKIATKVANDTFASETQTIDIVGKLGMLGIDVNEQQLRNLIDIAGTRPSVSTEHVGLAVQEALEGRSAMLKMYGINNAKLQTYLNDLKKSDPSQYKELKGAINKKGTVTDQQKYWLLLNSYIEQSPMSGYAETYMNTVKGKLERLSGVVQKAKAEIMGIDTNTGIAKEGGAFKAFGNAVDALKDKLDDPKTEAILEKVGKAFASVFTSISNGFGVLLESTDWDKVAQGISNTGKLIGDWLNELAKSGALEKLAENLPTIIESLLKWKATEETFNHPVATVMAENAKVTDESTTSGKFWNSGFGKYFQWTVPGMVTKGSQIANGYITDLVNLWRGGESDTTSSYTDNNSVVTTDNDLIAKIGRSNLNSDQITSLTDLIKNDGVSEYRGINVENMVINANNFDEIMASLKQASNNKK